MTSNELTVAYSVGYPEDVARTLRLKVGDGLVGAAVAEGQTILVNDVHADPRYVEALSPASRRSYAVQGARLALDEQLALETRPWFADAVRLRRWDDAAKTPDAACAPLIEYAPILERYFGVQAWPVGAGIDR